MQSIFEAVGDVRLFLAMDPSEVAEVILPIIKAAQTHAGFHPSHLSIFPHNQYPQAERSAWEHRLDEVNGVVAEGTQWLINALLLVPVMDPTNRATGWLRISRRGLQAVDPGRFKAIKANAAFPKELLHPAIAEKVWTSLARGDLADAVFTAFRTVEERVRTVGHFTHSDIGVPLMRQAFSPKGGPLADNSQPAGEPERLMELFTGAIGSYKNPHSHRTVTINDPREAQEMVMLASHLLGIVDSCERRIELAACSALSATITK